MPAAPSAQAWTLPPPAALGATGRGIAWGGTGGAASLLAAVRPALAAAPGGRALLLPPLPAAARRAAWLLVRDAARASGGTVVEAASGEMLLLGATAEAGEQARAGLAALDLPVRAAWRLPEDAAALLGWAQTAAPPARGSAAAASDPPPAEAGPERVPDGVVVRRSLLRLAPAAAPEREGWRLAVSRAALAGPAEAADPERIEEAAAAIARRLLDEPGAWLPPAGPAAAAGGLVLLPVPPDGHPPAPPVPGARAVLPLSAAASPRAFAAAEARLRAAGWAGLALEGLSAPLLGLLAPGSLPPAPLLLLRWSPALADRAGMAALRGLAPDRLLLTGCDAQGEAIAWGLAIGLTRFAGRALEAWAAGDGAGGR